MGLLPVPPGGLATAIGDPGALARLTEGVRLVIWKKTTFEAGPLGFTTVTIDVPAVAMSVAGTIAVN
jgi:hypothetical protein